MINFSKMQWTCVGFTISALFYSLDAIVYWTEIDSNDGNIHLVAYLGGSLFYLIACVAWITYEFPLLLPTIINVIVMKEKRNDSSNNNIIDTDNCNHDTTSIQMNGSSNHNNLV